jgi:uncharacterized membrane protein YhaH (DUF805 family)
VCPFVDACFSSHYEHWYIYLETRLFFGIVAAVALLGFLLEAAGLKIARFLNIGVWVAYAVKIVAASLGVWGGFEEDGWLLAFLIVPLALLIAVIDFLMYRGSTKTKVALAGPTSG